MAKQAPGGLSWREIQISKRPGSSSCFPCHAKQPQTRNKYQTKTTNLICSLLLDLLTTKTFPFGCVTSVNVRSDKQESRSRKHFRFPYNPSRCASFLPCSLAQCVGSLVFLCTRSLLSVAQFVLSSQSQVRD